MMSSILVPPGETPRGEGVLKIAELLEKEEGVIWLVDPDEGNPTGMPIGSDTRAASRYSTLVIILESAM
jgi:hypothetical protein